MTMTNNNRDDRLPQPFTTLTATVAGKDAEVMFTDENKVILKKLNGKAAGFGFRSLSGLCSYLAGHRRNGFRDFGIA